MSSFNPLNFSASQAELDQLSTSLSTIICIGLPKGWEFGLDYCSWVIGENFRGLRFVPPGAHYVYCAPTAAVPTHTSDAPQTQRQSATLRIGEWVYTRPKTLHVFRYDPSTEQLVYIKNEDERNRFAAGLARGDFETGLARYPLEQWSQWRNLTVLLTESILNACVSPQEINDRPQIPSVTSNVTHNATAVPENPNIQSSSQIAASSSSSASTSASMSGEQLLPQKRTRRVLPHERRRREEDLGDRAKINYISVPDASTVEAATAATAAAGADAGHGADATDGVPEHASGVAGMVDRDLTMLFFDQTWAVAHMLHSVAKKYRTHSGTVRFCHSKDACPLVLSPKNADCVCVRVSQSGFSGIANFTQMQRHLAVHDLADAIQALVSRWTADTTQETSNIPLPCARPLSSLTALLSAATAPSPAPLPWTVLAALPCAGLPLLAELQLAFAGLLVGEEYQSFLHWRDLTNALCHADRVLDDVSGASGVSGASPLETGGLRHSCLFYVAFLTVLAHQLHSLPQDMFIDALAADNFLRDALGALKLIVEAALQQHLHDGAADAALAGAKVQAGDDEVEVTTDAALTALVAQVRKWAPLDSRSQWGYLLYAWAVIESLVLDRFGLVLTEVDDEEFAPMIAGEDGGFL